MKICEYIDYCINELGVEKVFGIPGSLVMPIWQSISKAEIVLCSHEQEASYLAVGYVKMSKKPAIVITTGGPGVTNCISGIAAANIDSLPIIYISGRTPIFESGMGVLQEESNINRMYDSVDVLANFTKKSICIQSEKSATSIIPEMFNCAIAGRMGSVHISIPVDIQNCDVENEPVSIKKESNTVEEYPILELGKRPIIIIGWGVWMADCIDEVYRMSEILNAPVLVTSKGYCCIDKTSRFYVGKLGYGNNDVLNEFIKQYNPDSILAIGTSLGAKDLRGNILYSYMEYVDTYLITNEVVTRCGKRKIRPVECRNIKEYIEILIQKFEPKIEDKELVSVIRKTKIAVDEFWDNRIESDDKMAKYIKILAQLNEDVVFTADAGNHLANTGALITPKSKGSLFLDVGLRAMGTGICTAVGMALADDSKVYIAITGDGSMLMNGNVMHVAHEYHLPVIFVVFNNHSLGRVRVGQSIMNDYRATDIMNVDFQRYGETFKLVTYHYENLNQFELEIEEIISKKEASLVEIIVENDEIPINVKGSIN